MYEKLLMIAGHLCIGAVFIRGGIMHFMKFSAVADEVGKASIPLPKISLGVGSVWQIVFGALLILNLAVEVSALALLVFTIIVSVLLLDFWNKSGDERKTALTNFESNVAIVGGLLVTAAAA